MIKVATLFIFVLSTLSCPDGDQRCASCLNNVCQKCYNGYLNQGKCQAVTIVDNNCLSYVQNGLCRECNYGFTMRGGRCEKISLPFCMKLDPVYNQAGQEICSVCNRGVLATNGKCDEKYRCEINDCEYCERGAQNTRKCLGCKNGFTLQQNPSGNVCIKQSDKTKNCEILDLYNNCQQCSVNYYFSNGKCVKSGAYNLKSASGIMSTGLALLAYFFF